MDFGSAKSSPSVVDVPKPSTILTNHAIQAGEGTCVFQHSYIKILNPADSTIMRILSLGSRSSGKKIQPFVKEVTLNSVMDSGSAIPQSTKILIRPHLQGMSYDGPIQVSDDEWVAMKVNAHDGM